MVYRSIEHGTLHLKTKDDHRFAEALRRKISLWRLGITNASELRYLDAAGHRSSYVGPLQRRGSVTPRKVFPKSDLGAADAPTKDGRGSLGLEHHSLLREPPSLKSCGIQPYYDRYGHNTWQA